MMNFEAISPTDIDRYIGQAFIIDLRPRNEFVQEHITGAVSVPYEYLGRYYNQIPQDKEIILYCERGSISMMAARELGRMGYQVKTVVGGIQAYRGTNLESFY